MFLLLLSFYTVQLFKYVHELNFFFYFKSTRCSLDAFSKSKTEIISLSLVLKVHVLAGLEELNVSVID